MRILFRFQGISLGQLAGGFLQAMSARPDIIVKDDGEHNEHPHGKNSHPGYGFRD
jgi:hypothetical protein